MTLDSQSIGEPRFTYNALSTASSFRLLTLLPAKDKDSPIVCTLEEHTTSNAELSYKALSYTWGDTSELKHISVNGCPALVTPNLYEALQHLRALDYCKYQWWIDAICINQSDIHERNHQVTKMRDIFYGANEVVAWLGPSYDNSDEVMHFIQDRSFGGIDCGADHTRVYSKWGHRWCKISDLESFLLRPYWTRLWIVQELVVARWPTLLCGHQRLPWTFYNAFILRLKFEEPLAMEDYLLDDAADLCALRNNYRNLRGLHLATLLRSTRYAMAGEARDKVFGLLGMVGWGHGTEIAPDYELSICSTYCNAIRVMYRDYMDESHEKTWWLTKARECLEQYPHRPLDEDDTYRIGCDGIDCDSRRLCFIYATSYHFVRYEMGRKVVDGFVNEDESSEEST